jgi:hypoxanthine phosphoribosyltransferase
VTGTSSRKKVPAVEFAANIRFQEEAVQNSESGRPAESIGPVLLESRKIRLRVGELGTQITADYRGKAPHLICILKGAGIFHADLVRAIELDLSFDFMAIASYGRSTKSSGEVRILKDLDDSIEGRDVLLVEDIIDSGNTLHYIRHNLLSRHPRSLKIVALLNKLSRRRIDVPVDYIGFDIPDTFVVGYGLDYAQRYRNLPDIRILQAKDQPVSVSKTEF